MLIVFGDFNCPYSYLANLRINALLDAGLTDVEFRAVEHDRRMAVTGAPADAERDRWRRELADVAALALPGEQVPSAVPAVLSNTRAAVSAYAESLTDGVHRAMKDRLFDAIWVERRNISSAYEVRRIITDLMYPPVPLTWYRSTEMATPVCGDPDPARITRRLGGTVTPDGGPLTTTGWKRIRDWRHQWLALGDPVVPTVIDQDGAVHAGADALRFLAELVQRAATPAPIPAQRTEAATAGLAGNKT